MKVGVERRADQVRAAVDVVARDARGSLEDAAPGDDRPRGRRGSGRGADLRRRRDVDRDRRSAVDSGADVAGGVGRDHRVGVRRPRTAGSCRGRSCAAWSTAISAPSRKTWYTTPFEPPVSADGVQVSDRPVRRARRRDVGGDRGRACCPRCACAAVDGALVAGGVDRAHRVDVAPFSISRLSVNVGRVVDADDDAVAQDLVVVEPGQRVGPARHPGQGRLARA